jgi:hypothetical protein
MKLFFGFAGYYSTRLYDDSDRARRIATLLVDARWPWVPWWAQFGLRDDFHKQTRSRKVVGPKGSEFLSGGLTSPDYDRLFVYRSSQESKDFAAAKLYTGRRVISPHHEKPFETWGQTHGFEDPRDALTAECERKRAALELLMAPIVAPPQAKEEPIVFPP